tara:strand:+ start:966 stop:1232 length:267 start_codon:yes stop_codon:yes gene_type:complete
MGNQVEAQIENAAAGNHYARPGGGGEFLDAMRILYGDADVDAFCRIAAHKYIGRYDLKHANDPGGQLTDLRKAERFIDFLREQIQARE